MATVEQIHQRHLAAEKILERLGVDPKSDPHLLVAAMQADATYSLAEQVALWVEELQKTPIIAYCRMDQRGDVRKPERKDPGVE